MHELGGDGAEDRGGGQEGGTGGSFFLTPIMHCVAWDGHRWGHGNGSSSHGELVCDGVVSAAAGAGLARVCSWKERKCKIRKIWLFFCNYLLLAPSKQQTARNNGSKWLRAMCCISGYTMTWHPATKINLQCPWNTEDIGRCLKIQGLLAITLTPRGTGRNKENRISKRVVYFSPSKNTQKYKLVGTQTLSLLVGSSVP